MAVFNKQPTWETMPIPVRSMCDSQYCAAGLMLIGYSLEICLKGLLILTKGIASYTKDERQFQHHKLDLLAEQIPSLSEKDKATLRVLTHFTEWAGRYPDPGSGRDAKVEEIFRLSEQFQIAGRDLFALAARIMKHTQGIVNERTAEGSGTDA